MNLLEVVVTDAVVAPSVLARACLANKQLKRLFPRFRKASAKAAQARTRGRGLDEDKPAAIVRPASAPASAASRGSGNDVIL